LQQQRGLHIAQKHARYYASLLKLKGAASLILGFSWVDFLFAKNFRLKHF